MAFDIRKIFVILAVAILFTLFSYAVFDAFYPRAEYSDFCPDRPYYREYNDSITCEADGGKWNPYTGDKPLSVAPSGYCDLTYYCNQEYDKVNSNRDYYAFIFLSILGAIAIIIGINLPLTNPINQWIGTGFMLGGLFNIFFGTAMFYEDLGRILRPIVLFIELALVIFLTYKKLGSEDNLRKHKNRK